MNHISFADKLFNLMIIVNHDTSCQAFSASPKMAEKAENERSDFEELKVISLKLKAFQASLEKVLKSLKIHKDFYEVNGFSKELF